jgi:hypothetical protein
MVIRDRFTRGWISGACGGLIGGIISFLLFWTGLSQLRLTDWTAILVFGRTPPFSLADQIYALFVLGGSSGIIGILFVFIVPLITDKNLYFKGWIIYLIPWWIIYLLTALAKTEGTLNLSVLTALSDGISTSIAGIASVYFHRLFEPKSSSAVSHVQ